MVTTTLRNAIAKIGNTRSHIKISDYAKTPAIPIRHLAIGFKGKVRYSPKTNHELIKLR